MVTVSVEGLSVALGRREVVSAVSARFHGGELVGIIGPNGAGKSTLVRAMLGLVPAQTGSVSIDGVAVGRMAARDRARTLAYLPQGQTLHWPLDVERLVSLGRLPHLAPLSRIGADDRAAVAEAMARADVGHLAHRIATELSGGERARVMLARALAVGAQGLVVDEPLAALDPGHQIDVMELLAREAHAGALVVTVLHDLTMAARYCDRLILMDQGCVVAEGAPAAVLTAETLRGVYGISAKVDLSGTAPMVVPLERIR
ncbi:ABC transporter ATP-binding protein [Novosphingobium sp. JCM 18896]|uniref:ABC transporter ATP-binding protein n=1 Tax=Novosphingobium sp. JCM 18896 TaxID=2989731 RepID=UPI0022233217|nr:ABC transporter ATP-binding protein [Novosphingobium sp. JCM 18896]MCW1429920.1 ABC transporter ATP-binding protein [Novosphingobium sp. JCM 18896]